MKSEIWKPISNYEGYYEVSNFGRIKSLTRKVFNGWGYFELPEKILKLQHDRKGYLIVNLYKDGVRKTYKVHRLVAKEFIDNPNKYPIINHIDEVKDNNKVSNLEWCTVAYNNTYNDAHVRVGLSNINNKSKSTPVERLTLQGDFIEKYPSMQEAQRQGYNQCGISRCCSGEYKSHKGFKWRYAND